MGAFVPTKGWVLFGGRGPKGTNTLILSSPDGHWQEGPPLDDQISESEACTVQVN